MKSSKSDMGVWPAKLNSENYCCSLKRPNSKDQEA